MTSAPASPVIKNLVELLVQSDHFQMHLLQLGGHFVARSTPAHLLRAEHVLHATIGVFGRSDGCLDDHGFGC
ncbi:hypothetical protein APA35_13580 [Pseudomonas aeruginosa]|nr:hypothetical protein APA35_13580 [Pseudomonas aeruginosa]